MLLTLTSWGHGTGMLDLATKWVRLEPNGTEGYIATYTPNHGHQVRLSSVRVMALKLFLLTIYTFGSMDRSDGPLLNLEALDIEKIAPVLNTKY